MPNDDKIWAMLARYVFVTARQAERILGCKPDYINVRLRRLTHAGYLDRVQENPFSEFLYFFTEAGALKAIERGELDRKLYIQGKSLMQIPHDKGITNCQILLHEHFPEMESRRWRSDLQADFKGEVPDLFFDLKDGTGWTPFEYVRMNPIGEEKLADYDKHFKRAYVILPTDKRVLKLLMKIEDTLPSSKLWFTSEPRFLADPIGRVWYTPKNYSERVFSLLKPAA